MPEPVLSYAQVRDTVVMIGRLGASALDVDDLERAIQEAEHALSVGPILDPMAFMHGADELRNQITLMRATLAWRRVIEEFRPPAHAIADNVASIASEIIDTAMREEG